MANWPAIEAVAVGAGSLATVGLAWITRGVARATRAAVEASEEPFVIATPTDDWRRMTLRKHEDRRAPVPTSFHASSGDENWPDRPPYEIHRAHDDDGTSFVRMMLWNIGTGPAIVTDVRLYRDDPEAPYAVSDGQLPLRPGVSADVEERSPQWPMLGDGVLTITYTHTSGRTYRTRQETSIGDPIVRCRTYTRERLK